MYLSNPEYSNFIALSRYARWLPHLKRREVWAETVERYITFWRDRQQLDENTAQYLYTQIHDLHVMPSMRALMTAGAALSRDNVAGFNCSYKAVTDIQSFDEILYVLLCGTGVGFSVEQQYISQLPKIGQYTDRSIYESSAFYGVSDSELSWFDTVSNTIHVADSKYGWASALRILMVELYSGNYPSWDVSRVRRSGAPLETFGGRASGPAPLIGLFQHLTDLFRDNYGKQLSSIQVHSIVCLISQIVVVGGVRRAALISLSDRNDDRMRFAKSGQWWMANPEYGNANNSIAYTENPDVGAFMAEWLALYDSKSGERGIFNRQATKSLMSRRNLQDSTVFEQRRNPNYDFGTNPCAEITLRSGQFCNLSEVVVRHDDTEQSLIEKVKVATILGTLQATLTDFVYLRPEWTSNTKEEALLGASLTGIMDNPLTYTQGAALDNLLETLRLTALHTNLEWSSRLGINPSAAITCVKPSGTVSQRVDSSSGIHTRYSRFYCRTVRADKKDPLAKMMVDAGFPCEDDVTNPNNTLVFSFPMQSPANSVFRDDLTAIQQLELWKTYQLHYCDHKPSITVFVKEHEWPEVGAWTWKNFDVLSGVSFLPHSDHTYQQAPYQELTEEQYNQMLESMPKNVDWSLLGHYEYEDRTVGLKTLACAGGLCETVDLT